MKIPAPAEDNGLPVRNIPTAGTTVILIKDQDPEDPAVSREERPEDPWLANGSQKGCQRHR